MKEFLVQKSCLDEPSTSTSTATALDLANKNSAPPRSLPEEVVKESQKITLLEVHQEPGSSSSGSQQILNKISSHPALWNAFCMSSETRQILVERGPHQTKKFEFLINKAGRRFSLSHYLKVLTVKQCDWPKKDYSDRGNLIRAFTMQQKSVNHKNASRTWKELDIRLKQEKTIDAEYQRIMYMEIQHWRGVLKKIMSIIRLLALQCLAFHGTTEHLLQPNNRNFLKLIELLYEFDSFLEEHIRRVQRESDKWSETYLSSNIQDKLINAMGNVILSKIVEITKIAKYFSIIANCTPDMKIAANVIAENLECSTEFPTETEVRARRKKHQFDYEEAVDEPLTGENKFKINFISYILDITLSSLNERFTLLETHSKSFSFYMTF
ncbi:hypothetical protein ILUMI_03365 [Ignelater luminosus]|uniref:DUF4371 domain-containing protein n=1 Tax=Ignelater luminosus TaxID=2038154 RepID=A0A8K0GKI7_IGNLU|nr:hypothetical protein ILUMI_03365 [Ignelater luminosus]